MNKRGSHIGVIISFIVFIGMIVFLYSVLAPNISSGQNKDVFIDSLSLNLKNALSGNMTTISIYANDSSFNCVNLSDFASNANLPSPLRAIAQDSNGNVEASGTSGGGFYIIRSDSSSKFFNVYASPSFGPSSSNQPGESCTTLDYGNGAENYRIGQVKTSEYVFESKVKTMISNYGDGGYGSGYSQLKTHLDVSDQNDFGFDFVYQNGTPIETASDIPASSNVYSESYPVSYVNVNGSVQSGELVVKVW